MICLSLGLVRALLIDSEIERLIVAHDTAEVIDIFECFHVNEERLLVNEEGCEHAGNLWHGHVTRAEVNLENQDN